MSLIYAAMPIDMSSGDQPFLEFAMGDLKASKHVVYRPDRSFTFAKGLTPTEVIQEVNNAAIERASGMVAFLPKDVASIGVPMEIQMAVSAGKPVVVVTDHDQSWVVAGWRNHPMVEVVEFNAGMIRKGIAWLNRMVEAYDYEDQGGPMFGSFEEPKPLTMPVIFEAKEEGAVLPTRAYETDAGFDLYVSKTVHIPQGGFADVPSGVSMQINAGEWALITGRSSSIRKKGLLVTNGVIDAGYSGELFAGVQNMNPHGVTIKKGDRVAQIILMPAAANGREAVFGKVAEAPRGDNGFGSSGR